MMFQFHKNHKETGDESPVSLLEEKTNNQDTYKKGIRHGMFLTVALCALLALGACGVAKMTGTDGSSAANSETEDVLQQVEQSEGNSQTENAVSGSGDATIGEVFDEETLAKTAYILNLLNEYYYEGIDVDDMQEGIYKGLVEGLGDEYTVYRPAEEAESQRNMSRGNYSGVGIVLAMDADTGYPMASFLYENSPALEAGIQEGDLIIAIDGEDITSDMALEDIASTIRGETGTEVVLTILRDQSEELDFTLVRAEVEVSSVAHEMLSDNVGYIRIGQFAENTEEQFRSAYEELFSDGMQYMIIDVRNNGGGLVEACSKMLDDILPEGITVSLEDQDGKRVDYTSDEENQLDIPIAVLMNGNSASASEIFAAAIRDYEYGTLIGTTTFGKGVYQAYIDLPDESSLAITIGKFYSPKGNNFHKVGIEPDIEIEYENLGGEDAEYSYEVDNQIQKAIEVLTQGE